MPGSRQSRCMTSSTAGVIWVVAEEATGAMLASVMVLVSTYPGQTAICSYVLAECDVGVDRFSLTQRGWMTCCQPLWVRPVYTHITCSRDPDANPLFVVVVMICTATCHHLVC